MDVSLFAGMSPAALQAALAQAQAAYLALCSGQSVASASYAQGDGSKAVTYRQVDRPALAQLIRQLQQQLGIISRTRRPLRFVYR